MHLPRVHCRTESMMPASGAGSYRRQSNMDQLFSRTLKWSAVAIGVSAIAACSSSTDVGANAPTQLSFTTSSPSAANGSAAIVPITNGGHTLDLTQATLTIARAELKSVAGDECRGEDENEADSDRGGDHGDGTSTNTEDCAEVKVGPTSIDLPLTGTLVTVPANAIPAGTFRELELRVSSVHLRGTFDTKAFDVTLPVDARGEIEFATPLVVTNGTPTSITINVPVNTWLVNADGSLIDPNAIATSPSLMSTIQSRIAASLRAFEDEDHDGRDDHDGHDGHGGHGDG
jgi:hypothetical protein